MSELIDIGQAKKELFSSSNRKNNEEIDKDNRFWLTRYELNLLQNGDTPFQYLLSVMRDQFNPPDIRMKAATTLMPYVQQMAPRAMELENLDEMSPAMVRESRIVREKLAALVGVILTPPK